MDERDRALIEYRSLHPITRPSPDGHRTETERVFSQIYRTNAWQGTVSVSGPSSSLERTATLREALPKIIAKYQFKTFLDAPCGDFFWMKTVMSKLSINYIGADIVNELILRNIACFASSNISFTKLDITFDQLPITDIIFCRDCLFHLSYNDIARVLLNFLRSDCEYLMTTSHNTDDDFINSDIKTGEWRYFDLLKSPFNLPANFLEAVDDGGGDRKMYLWKKQDIAVAIGTFISTLAA